MTASPIEVLAIRKLDGTSSVKAFVDVRVGGLVLKGGKIVAQEGQRAWYATPSIKTNHEIASKDLRERITAVVLEAWAAHQERGRLPTRGQRTHDRARAAGQAHDHQAPFFDDADLAVADLEGRR